ncbi:carboxypeptidase-like regulatory domain-containing protein [Erythrobacter sp. THAF29]|uniref:carboxypeptidase-like regulatory domain-containing protein n=1 Tax=Erythrobacter sp. THAF29 TaxID=2587851 RepID=UPI0012695176|nr:carboxypeptidase-like regulatory domain-containing protein [Erythrobacter sp. THAF29]QFT76053.1 hypothetical protein FIU90_00725 [Erythrobacter sp. THAF29]
MGGAHSQGMFALTLGRTMDWLGEALAQTQLEFVTLGDFGKAKGATLSLVSIFPVDRGTSARRRSHFSCVFLLAFHDKDPIKVGDALACAVRAAEKEADAQIRPQPEALALMEDAIPAGGVGMLFEVPLERPPAEEHDVKLVRHPLVAKLAPLAQVRGGVVTEDGHPVVGAHVAIEGLDRTVKTDRKGRFEARLPLGDAPISVTATKAGRTAQQTVATGEETELELATGD